MMECLFLFFFENKGVEGGMNKIENLKDRLQLITTKKKVFRTTNKAQAMMKLYPEYINELKIVLDPDLDIYWI
uniref:Uncharacterized protein n=1 Tax=Meloidogyne enterolobii TaxID=390850 RepID=A0A6V7WCG8_MELEN|nr:unnamed protein product [Meloidogyne enterolobii]